MVLEQDWRYTHRRSLIRTLSSMFTLHPLSHRYCTMSRWLRRVASCKADAPFWRQTRKSTVSKWTPCWICVCTVSGKMEVVAAWSGIEDTVIQSGNELGNNFYLGTLPRLSCFYILITWNTEHFWGLLIFWLCHHGNKWIIQSKGWQKFSDYKLVTDNHLFMEKSTKKLLKV